MTRHGPSRAGPVRGPGVGTSLYLNKHQLMALDGSDLQYTLLAESTSQISGSQHEPLWPGVHHLVYRRVARRVVLAPSDRSARLCSTFLSLTSIASGSLLTTSAR